MVEWWNGAQNVKCKGKDVKWVEWLNWGKIAKMVPIGPVLRESTGSYRELEKIGSGAIGSYRGFVEHGG